MPLGGRLADQSLGLWNEKSKLANVLIVARRAICSAAFDPASLADGNLLGERRLDCLGCGRLTTLELLDDVVDS